MNYQLIYNNIVNRHGISLRKKGDGVYYEKHHIIPKCMGGSNSKENLVLLTAKEHYLCHRLLCEIYPNNRKLLHALWAMTNFKNISNNQQRIYYISSREYELIKNKLANIRSEYMKLNNPMKDINLRYKKQLVMTNDNLWFKLNDAQKLKHKLAVSKSKMGGKNPKARKCIYLNIEYPSMADCGRINNIKTYKLLKSKDFQWK